MIINLKKKSSPQSRIFIRARPQLEFLGYYIKGVLKMLFQGQSLTPQLLGDNARKPRKADDMRVLV